MDHRFSKTDRDYIIGLRGEYLQGIRISKKFLDLIDAPEELKAKFETFKSKYGKYPQFRYDSELGNRAGNTCIHLQKTINGINVENFFTEEDIETLVDCWVDTYTEAYDWLNARSTAEKVVENVCDFVEDNKLAEGCAIFGVAALAGVIPAIVNKYKSEADIREAVSYFMDSVEGDENDRNKTIHTTYTSVDSKGVAHTNTRTIIRYGNKSTSKDIFTAVAKYAKKNGITVRDAFHELDGKKSKTLFGKETNEDFYRFDILEDNDGVLTINVWNNAGRKPKTFEIDTNTYQKIGDVQYSWNESRKRTGRIKESTSWEKKFEQKIKQRVVRIFQDWVDEDNAQGMVDDFDIHPDNAVEELINEILENEADEIHEGRYEDFLYTIMDEEDINQKEIEKVGEAYLDKLEALNIEEKRKTFGKSYCNKLEKQMQYVSAFGDDEDEDYTEKPSDYEKYWKIEPEAIERFRERARELERRIVYNVHWRYMPYKESEKDEMFFEINYNYLEIKCDGTGRIYKVIDWTGATKTLATLGDIITAKDVDEAFDKYSEIINIEKYFRN